MNYPKRNYPRDARWHKIHRYPSECNRCHAKGEKSDFIPLYVRMTSYDSKRILCRLCPECLSALATELEITLPEED